MYEVDREQEILKYLPLVERVANRISIKNTEYEYDDLYNIGVIGLIDAMQKFDSSKKVPFENTEINIPNNNDKFLKKVYGDYMKIPPENERVNHMPLIIQFEGEEPIYAEK